MSDLLSSFQGGIARFALAWLLPTAIAVGLFWGLCVPSLVNEDLLPGITGGGNRVFLEALSIAAFIGFSISVVLAYSSQLIYRLLEGYHLPSPLGTWLGDRQRTRRERLIATVDVLGRHQTTKQSKEYGLAVEHLEMYPRQRDLVLPTRLGNALRSLETYGMRVYRFDSQQFWYELVGTAEETVRREYEEARSMVDLFIAGVAVFAGLTIASTAVAVCAPGELGPWALAIFAATLVPIAYRGALRNMKEWRNSTRALVNLGRHRVAGELGLELPWRLEDEQLMWQSASDVFHYGGYPESRAWLDVFRRGTPYRVERRQRFGASLLDQTEAEAHQGE